MRKLFVCYVLLLLAPVMAASSAGSLPSTEEGLLDLLDRELIRRDGYIRKRIASADSLNKLIASQSERENGTLSGPWHYGGSYQLRLGDFGFQPWS